jgi:hypothetical protein
LSGAILTTSSTKRCNPQRSVYFADVVLDSSHRVVDRVKVRAALRGLVPVSWKVGVVLKHWSASCSNAWSRTAGANGQPLSTAASSSTEDDQTVSPNEVRLLASSTDIRSNRIPGRNS